MNTKPQDMTLTAFISGRENLNRLRSGSSSDEGAEGENYFTRVGEQESVSYATGKGVKDTNPRNKSVPWTTFCGGVEAYASEIVGPTEADKKRSKYIIAGEVRKTFHTDTDTRLGPVLSNREDVSVVSTTLLILDCDSPVAPHPLARALDELALAYCIAPTWSSTLAEPRWRCFIPILPLVVDNSDRGRLHARLRYAWLAGLLAELAELPVACPTCGGENAGKACPSCKASGIFSFDLSCWNFSRLHFLGGKPYESADGAGAAGGEGSADRADLGDRTVQWAKGFALDTEAWLKGSGFNDHWAAIEAEARPARVFGDASTLAVSADDIDTDELHPDPEIGAAIAACEVGLLERVRRACLYVSSPQFPASVSGSGGHTTLMRAASAVVSGFLLPSAWAVRVIEVCFNPRCVDLGGQPYPWSSRDIVRKVRDVRIVNGEPGSMLERRSSEGEVFYVIRSDGRQGYSVSDAGVYSALGEQKASTSWTGGILDLSIEAARACTLKPFDPEALPPGFKPRRMVMGAMYDLRGGVAAAVGGAAVAAAAVSGAAPASTTGEPRIGLVQPLPGSTLGGGFVSSGARPASGGGLGSGGLGAKGGVHIPADSEWIEPVMIHEDDNLAKRIITERMNARFAVVKLPRDCVIVDTAANAGRRGERAYMTINGFRTDQQRFPLRIESYGSKGAKKSKEANRADIWLSSPYRREYDEWGFAPELTPEECEAVNIETGRRRLLNTYRGWGVGLNPEGLAACPRFKELIDEVIANGDAPVARYLWTWFADIFQRPAEKPGVALYLYSPEKGTGKGTLFRTIGYLLGRYYQLVQSADQVAGQWNLHLADKLLIFFDEANGLEGRDKSDKLNSLITEAEFAGSEKFAPLQTCRAYARFAFAANRDDSISIKIQDRRYAAIRVSPKRRRDNRFFELLNKELFAPCEAPAGGLDVNRAARGEYRGLSGLMYHLLKVVTPADRSSEEATVAVNDRPELGGSVNLREIPMTDLRQNMMLSSLEGVEAFIFSSACVNQHMGFVDRSTGGARTEKAPVSWPKTQCFTVVASEFTELYNRWAKDHKQRLASSGAAKTLEGIFRFPQGTDSRVVDPGACWLDHGKDDKPLNPPHFVCLDWAIDRRADGVRLYHLPSADTVWLWFKFKYGW